MSHTMGVMCNECREILIEDGVCPEGCGYGHGYTFQQPSEWAREHWPLHNCFINLPDGVVLDTHLEQNLADKGIYYVVMPDETRQAWATYRTQMTCVVCEGGEDQDTCLECHGAGVVDGVPWCPRPWDQIIPGLWLGGHHTQDEDQCVVTDEFDLVVSLFRLPGYGPNNGVRHISYSMEDADLDPEHHTTLDEMAEGIVQQLIDGKKVLVRCQAGMNRSGLLAGLAMVKMGWTVDDILRRMRKARSPYVLFNQSFVDYLRKAEVADAQDDTR